MTPAETAAGTIDGYRMLLPGERVLAAFSGGADSTAMALLLKELGYDVVLAHVDHGMRPSSSDDARHCRNVARRLGLAYHESSVTVEPATQAEARRVRYAALQRMAEICGAGKIATGHTMDDQAETVMLRLDRGGYGLGIPPVRDNIVRPILDLRRKDTEQVCRGAAIEFCSDPSNTDPRYRRVAARMQLARAPEGEIGRLTALARASRAEAEALAARVETLWPELVRSDARRVTVHRHGLQQAGGPVQNQLLRRAAAGLGVELTNRVIRDIVGKVLAVTGARLALPGGLSVWSERDRLVMGTPHERPVLPVVAVAESGTTCLPGWGAEFKVESGPVPAPGEWPADRAIEFIDASLVEAGLTVRQWRPGDRFRPLGAPGSRKLQDFFVDAGVPRAARHRVPLIVCGGEIVWVGGHRLDDRFKVTSATVEALRLTLAGTAREEVA
ncbi:tRNA lysidine(34) synthetase TilS [soil metagenome]